MSWFNVYCKKNLALLEFMLLSWYDTQMTLKWRSPFHVAHIPDWLMRSYILFRKWWSVKIITSMCFCTNYLFGCILIKRLKKVLSITFLHTCTLRNFTSQKNRLTGVFKYQIGTFCVYLLCGWQGAATVFVSLWNCLFI